jgi:hypothetical protein
VIISWEASGKRHGKRRPRRTTIADPSATNAVLGGPVKADANSGPYSDDVSQVREAESARQTRHRGCSTWYSIVARSRWRE